MRGRSFRVFSSLGSSGGLLSDFLLLVLFLGLDDVPLLFSLDGELKGSLYGFISLKSLTWWFLL